LRSDFSAAPLIQSHTQIGLHPNRETYGIQRRKGSAAPADLCRGCDPDAAASFTVQRRIGGGGNCSGVASIDPEVNLTKSLLFTFLLPPLIFQAAFSLEWQQLRADLPVVLLLAGVGVALSGAVTAAGMHFFSHWSWASALVFGALISATDPVSVIAAFKGAKVRGRLPDLVESESLFNDGTAAVAFAICVAAATGSPPTLWQVSGKFVLTIGGSLVSGAVVAYAVLLLAGRTEDHLVEITFTTVAAYGSFLLAEHLHFSGVLATLVAGLMLGNMRPMQYITEVGREAIQSFWDYAAFVANSLVFLLIGIRVAQQHFQGGFSVPIAIALVLLARAIAVYLCCGVFSRSTLRVSIQHQQVLFWGGLRGALALALALALPAEVPGRESVISISIAVVAFSIFVQGLTMRPMLRRLDEIPA
jgi:CPA1 family monovalent cation:H+ antiporter